MLIKRTLIWGALTAFLFVLFYYLIPVNLYQSFTTFIALLGAISIAISSALFVGGIIFLIEDRNGRDKSNPGVSGYFMAAVFMIGLFGGGFLFIYRETTLVEEELDKNGVFTVAKVTGGDSYSTRRLDMTKIRVMFKLDNGLNTTQDVSISKYAFDNYYLDQELPIVYSPKYPSVVRLLTSEAEIYKYQLRK
ncbi:hypothetical protein [Pedobacter nototheniae]|uniref:hypothetical protein n=1 Tax=Pedobacter nototheniae TaxID=2488994 RepID=UPI002930E9B0|nr:hypothetical protein [Pedobacter nototheniae]